MAIEIERKFLVTSDAWREEADAGRRFCQGYVVRDGKASVRVRRAGETAFLTVKSARIGIARAEFEYAIPVDDAEEMLASLCVKPLIEKTRYRVRHCDLVWEVDVFAGRAEGLVIAEAELARADQPIEVPAWVDDEVTNDPRFRSAKIAADGAAVLIDER